MYNYLKNFTSNLTYFHAQRSDGHSIATGMDKIPNGTELLIIVDSSTSNEEECKLLYENGIDVIILDHHPVDGDLNKYAIVVNPALDNYPNKSLSGSAVCWKMTQVLDNALGTSYSDDLIDLAGFGLVSDMMDMSVPENRYIVDQSMKNVKNIGLKAILKKKYIDISNVTTTNIGFFITPMINGATRLDQMEVPLELLTTDSEDRCKELVKELDALNERRKLQQKEYLDKLLPLAKDSDKVSIFIDNEIGKGYAGLVANDLAKKLQRPVAILSDRSGGIEYQGSYRSHDNFDLKSFFRQFPQVAFSAGHPSAGGIGVPVNQLQSFIEDTNEEWEKLTDSKGDSAIHYDLELDARQINKNLIEKVFQYSRITGIGCETPIFLVKGLFIGHKEISPKGRFRSTTDHVDLIRFRSDEEYHNQFPLLSEIEALGTFGLYKHWETDERTQRKKAVFDNQLFLEDYRII